ncbi:MAG TPA: hypothetical protein VLF60_00900 [Candidatus Saccharimonadales bacterium]|nr:hypothetical protein [Candidatus Saccharimonadales bacterium]
MAQQIYQQRNRSGRSNLPEEDQPLDPSSSEPNQVSANAQDTIDNIDDVLKDAKNSAQAGGDTAHDDFTDADYKDVEPQDEGGARSLYKSEKLPPPIPPGDEESVDHADGGGNSLYKPTPKGKGNKFGGKNKLKGFLGDRRKTAGGLIAAVTLIIGSILGIQQFPSFQAKFTSKPMRHLAQKLNKAIMDRRMRRYIDSYLAHSLAEDIVACGSLKNIDCIKKRSLGKKFPDSKVGKMMEAWNKDGKFAEMLLKTGVNVEEKGGKLIFTTSKGVFEVADLSKGLPKDLSKDLLERFKRVGFIDFGQDRRFANFMRKTFGVSLCVFFCKIAEFGPVKKLSPVAKALALKDAMKAIIKTRLIEPAFGDLGSRFLMDCMMQRINCAKQGDVLHEAEEGRSLWKKALERVSGESVDKLVAAGAKILAQHLSEGLFKTALEKLSTQLATSDLPIIGQAILAARLSMLFHELLKITLDPNNKSLKIMHKELVVAQAIPAMGILNSSDSEATAVGKNYDTSAARAISDQFSGFQKSEIFKRTFGAASFAPAGQQGSYTCNDGKQIPKGAAACNNERLDKNPPIKELLDACPECNQWILWADGILGGGLFTQIIYDWLIHPSDQLLGWIIDNTLFQIPGVKNFVNFLGKKLIGVVTPFLIKASEILFDPLFRNALEAVGGPLWNAAFIGNDYSNYKFAIDALGGRQLSKAEAKAIAADAAENDQVARSEESFKERIFSSDDSQSLATQFALNSPFTGIDSPQSLIAALNPFKLFSNAMLALSPAHASYLDYQLPEDRFGVPSAGIPLDDPCLTDDPWNHNNDAVTDNRPNDDNNLDAIGEHQKDKVACLIDNETAPVGGLMFDGQDLLDPVTGQ